MKSILLFIVALLFSLNITAGLKPKKGITLLGKLKNNQTKIYLDVDKLEKLNSEIQKVHDPYLENKLVNFKGILLSELYKKYANKEIKIISVKAENDYISEIPLTMAQKEKTLLAFKMNNQYLDLDEMGPYRIVKPNKGIIPTEELPKEGLQWVWFVKEITFK